MDKATLAARKSAFDALLQADAPKLGQFEHNYKGFK
jgi:hypothetical protein